jgi:hypothetical protein
LGVPCSWHLWQLHSWLELCVDVNIPYSLGGDMVNTVFAVIRHIICQIYVVIALGAGFDCSWNLLKVISKIIFNSFICLIVRSDLKYQTL